MWHGENQHIFSQYRSTHQTNVKVENRFAA